MNFALAKEVVPSGMRHYYYSSNGQSARYHLRVDPNGQGVLIVNASRLVRLSKLGVEICSSLFAGENREKIIQSLATKFPGLDKASGESEVSAVEKLFNLASLQALPVINFDDPSFSGQARLLDLPLGANLYLAQIGQAELPQIEMLIDRLWQLQIPQIVISLPLEENSLDPAVVVRAVEKAEDLGMIAGVRSPASLLEKHNLLPQLAAAGVDFICCGFFSPEDVVHDAVFGARDLAALESQIASCQKLEVCLAVEIPLVVQTIFSLESMFAWLERRGVGNAHFFALVADSLNGESLSASPAAEASLTAEALGGGFLPQAAAIVDDLASAFSLQDIWLAPVRRDVGLSFSQQVRAGAVCLNELSIALTLDGEVYPPRGRGESGGNLYSSSWAEISKGRVFTSYREMLNSDSRCQHCPGLAVCAVACPADTNSWATASWAFRKSES